MPISLFIAGDVVPKGIMPEVFCSTGERIFCEMKPFATAADFAIVNLEAPLLEGVSTPIRKSGPCLRIASSTVDVLKDVGFDIFTLANNHFFDQGQKGVDMTIDICRESDISVVGGGKSCTEARRPLFLDKDGKRIVIVNACEHEFSIATSEHGGSNPLDLINIQEDIVRVRPKADFVVLIFHGGIEQYHYPTPRMKRWYRHFIDLGADAIVNHHQHCMNGYEVYNGKPIFYGLGNFYFPWGQVRPESWNYGYAVQLILDKKIGYDLIPYKQTVDKITLRNRTEFDKEIELLNIPITNDFLLQQKFDEYILDNENAFKNQLLPSFLSGKYFSALVRRGLLGKLYRASTIYALKNKLTCESHYETIQRLFTIYTKH